MTRGSMSDYSWFREGGLAIADVVWTEEFGLCSHQPMLDRTFGYEFRMCDLDGNVHYIHGDLMFQASREERQNYWKDATWYDH